MALTEVAPAFLNSSVAFEKELFSESPPAGAVEFLPPSAPLESSSARSAPALASLLPGSVVLTAALPSAGSFVSVEFLLLAGSAPLAIAAPVSVFPFAESFPESFELLLAGAVPFPSVNKVKVA